VNIPFILEKAVSVYAQKEAIVARGRRFTYGEFACRVYKLANFLGSVGIKKGDCVAILHENSHEFLESYFSTAQLGAIINPLNIRLSAGELALILKDSGAVILVASRRFSSTVNSLSSFNTELQQVIWTGEGAQTGVFEAADYEDAIKEGSSEPVSVAEVSQDDVAQLYYTSGTTGEPKGVILTHKNVCTHALATIGELRLSDADSWIHVAPLFHLADAWATFAITWVGARHISVADFEPQSVLESIQNERATITNMIPTMWNVLVNTPAVDSYDFSSLRVVLSGGAPIAPDLVRKIMTTFRCDYIQTYGMTETCPYLTLSILKEHLTRLSPEEQFAYKAKTGRPMMGVLLKVVRDNGEEVNCDSKEVGEIIVKGDIVTQGYWNKPEETASAIKDGWLYTGDLAVVDREGYVNIVDRKKDMIVTGGENVYSTEVENVLYSHPAILEAAVIGVPDAKWGEAVKAVVVLREGKEATEEDIIRYCRDHIAHYKAPKTVDLVSELPKTGSGKIYKKALRQRYTHGSQKMG
jgi:fatty-acyl-CoA synthase